MFLPADPLQVACLPCGTEWIYGEVVDSADRFRQTLATVAERGCDGEDVHFAVREFLDEYALRPPALRQASIASLPPLTGDMRWDAFLGALAEFLSLRDGLAVPQWCLSSERFLDTFWFVSGTAGFRAISIAQAPISFKRRGVMIPQRSLTRV